MELFQLLLSGLASGCVYGLIALGFVLIYKATEAINFAQGDMMMFGAFITIWLTNSGYNNLPFLFSVPLMILIMGAFGFLIERIFLRKVIGQSQIAIAILTIALGFILRFLAGAVWGHEPHFLESPMVGKNIYLNGVINFDVFIITATIKHTMAIETPSRRIGRDSERPNGCDMIHENFIVVMWESFVASIIHRCGLTFCIIIAVSRSSCMSRSVGVRFVAKIIR